MGLNKLSYKTYGNLVISVLVALALGFTLFPFCFYEFNLGLKFIEFFIYLVMIPIYLISRYKYDYPIHMKGLNKCFIFTISFYILLDTFLYLTIKYLGHVYSFILGSIITCLATYFTSELTNIQEEKGKLFWGYKNKGEPSKYEKFIEYLKFNALTDEYLKAEELLKQMIDSKQFIVYKRIFFDKQTWNDVENELDVNRLYISKTLDQCYFYMIGRLRI